MAQEGSNKSSNPIGLLAALVFSAIFATTFGAGGYWFGLKPLVQTLHAALEVRGWHPVQAQVLSADLTRPRRSSDEDAISQVQARYRYTFAGRTYEGSRVGLDPVEGADNISDWHQRWQLQLQGAKASGQPVTVLVNPRNPSESLIDPDIRWQVLAFRLPFALVFTGVGLVAAWIFVRALWGLLRPGTGAESGTGSDATLLPASGLQGAAGKSVGGIWLFSFFWCGMAFPMASILWSTERAPWFAKALMGLFVAVGLVLLAYAVQKSRMAWRYAGSGLTATPQRPRGGQAVEISLMLPERAVAYQHGKDLQLRLAQYRVDESSSGSPERRVEFFCQPARVQPSGDFGLRLAARFELPHDAPPHGAQRSGERVDWRLELLHGTDGEVQLTYDLPVQAAVQGFGPAEASQPHDRFDRRAGWNQITRIEPPGDLDTAQEGPLRIPANVTVRETPQAWHYTFRRAGWRWAAVLVVAGLALEAVLHDRVAYQGLVVPPRGFFQALAWWALAAFALHAATCRWALAVHDRGITVRRHSLLWSRTQVLPGRSSQTLAHKLLYTTGSGGSENRYYAVYAQVGDQDALVQLTPGLKGDAAATAVGQSLAQAWSHRQRRFSPGALGDAGKGHTGRPVWGALLLGAALIWSIWGPKDTSTHIAAGPQATTPSVDYSAVDGRLLDAQNAGDAPALRSALAEGANPNLLAPSGSSVLMLAAHRGQLDHIESLLAAGAQVDLRQTHKDSERGDTALLRAFYGGHLEAAQRLVQAGGSLAVRNRWDWGPVHMAAQSGCIQCLEWLAAQGQAVDEPATASRGETPAMLAAGRGRVEALQWFETRGVDLARKDAHGNTALDWARFKQQVNAERWLADRVR